MKLLTNGVYRVVPAKREQVMQHIGPAGIRRYTQAVADYDVPGAQADVNGGTWAASFVAGDLISLVAGRVGGGPLEISVLDDRGRTLVSSTSPNGFCYAGAKIPRSGVYSVRVRQVPLSSLICEAAEEDLSDCPGWPAPFKLCCTRQLPRILPARLTPKRLQVGPHLKPNPLQRLFSRFASRVGREADTVRHALELPEPDMA